MIRPALPFLPIALVAAAVAAAAGEVRAETTTCTAITSLPATIASPGVYCLKQDLSTAMTSGAAITVNANNVVIDCNDRRIGGLAGGAGTNTDGIVANARTNLTVRRCTLRGFRFGFYLVSGSGHLIEDNRVDGSTFQGIAVTGDAHVIRRNRVLDTGGREATNATGIHAAGLGMQIVDNQVSGIVPAGPGDVGGYGILASGLSNLIAGNHVSEVYPVGDAFAMGIGGDGVLRGNTVVNSEWTVGYGIGVGGSDSICAENIASRYASGSPECSKVGYNAGF